MSCHRHEPIDAELIPSTLDELVVNEADFAECFVENHLERVVVASDRQNQSLAVLTSPDPAVVAPGLGLGSKKPSSAEAVDRIRLQRGG